ncbi:MAG: NAD-dependent epimerase/dehydratase family protein [Desulfosarcinaceae bacterium]
MIEKLKMFYRGKRVLVTGGSGLIGSAFLSLLVGLDTSVRTVMHKRDVPNSDGVDILPGSLLDRNTALNACRGMDMVIHAAGVSGGSKQVTVDPIPMFSDSLLMNTMVLESARIQDVDRYLFISNSSVYAKSDSLLNESDAWGETSRGIPENETGSVKRIGETQCALYARHTNMKIGIMRTGNAYGPNDNFDLESSHVLPALMRKAVEKQDPFCVWGDGSTLRDFIHTEDIARAGLFLLANYAVAQPVNVATGKTYRIQEVVEMICDIAGLHRNSIKYQNNAPPASPAKRLDISRMIDLGLKPQISLRDGLSQTISWYRKQRGGQS